MRNAQDRAKAKISAPFPGEEIPPGLCLLWGNVVLSTLRLSLGLAG